MIDVTRRGRIAVARMAHGKASALDLELCGELRGLFSRIADDDAAAWVLTGTGSIFSAGVDLVRLREGGPSYVEAFVAELERMLGALTLVGRPVVAAVNGHAIAGGCVLVQGCDWRVMAEGRATIGVAELRVGVPFPPVAFELMRAALAPSVLRSALLFGDARPPADALRDGLVDEVVAPEAVLDRAVEVAERLAAIPPVSFALNRRQRLAGAVRAAGGPPLPGAAEIVNAWQDPAVQASIADFVRRTLSR